MSTPDFREEICTSSKLAQHANSIADVSPGLRERKKLETREALAAAAMRLALRHGLDRLRVEDVAAEANVSVRTFHNYFGSTSDALTAFFEARMRHGAAVLTNRPAEEPLWDAIRRAVLFPMETTARGHTAPDPASIAELRLMFDAPAVQSGILRASFMPNSPFAVAVAQRTGTDADHDMFPKLVAAVVTVATQVAINTFLRADPPVPLAPLMCEALDTVAAGLPDPSKQTLIRKSRAFRRLRRDKR